MRLRTPLFAPADSERKVAKALASPADAVILDLEDSVAPTAKDGARAATAALLASAPSRPGIIVRVNPRDTAWYLPDLAAVVPGRPAAILLPKCTGPADLRAIDHHLEALETASGLPVGGIGVLALVTETAASLRCLDYRGITPRLRALLFGAEDLAADLGISPRDADGNCIPRRSPPRARRCSSPPRRRAFPPLTRPGPIHAIRRGCRPRSRQRYATGLWANSAFTRIRWLRPRRPSRHHRSACDGRWRCVTSLPPTRMRGC